jgi:uncharacterized protein (TIGR03083 family)
VTIAVDQTRAEEMLSELRRSHERLADALAGLSDEQLAWPSYADQWSIAQVASHLGSGAEIFVMFVDAGLRRAPAPGVETFQPIWSRWNAKGRAQQSRDAVVADAELLRAVEALAPEERADWRLDLFGARTNLAELLGMRLGEHAVHTWDIAVALDPAATITDGAAGLIIDNLPGLAGRVGKAMPNPRMVHVATPHRKFVLVPMQDGVRLEPASSASGETLARLRLPAEAFVRLVYGRLDAEHTPTSVEVEGIDLSDLRATFPGF